MISLLDQSVGDVVNLKVKAGKFVTNTGNEANIAWYAVRLTSDGTCCYGKGSNEKTDDSILSASWSAEEF